MVRIEELTLIEAPIERCFDLARSVEAHLAGAADSGEQVVANGGISAGLIGLGERVTWRAKHLGVWHELTSEITAMERPAWFRDVMIRGPFKSMAHDHFFRATGEGSSELRDVFEFAAPVPVLGRLAEKLVLERHMRSFLRKKNAILKRIAESAEWRKYLENAARP